jgi:hypothetical protein
LNLTTSPPTVKLEGALTERQVSPSHEASDPADLYAHLLPRKSAASHVSNAFIKTTVLFSDINVKPADGDKSEAEYQINMVMSVSMRKKAEIAQIVRLLNIASALIKLVHSTILKQKISLNNVGR